jgi:zinc transport system permease protein
MLMMLNLATITAHADGKLTITTTLFPQYDFAKAIAGDKADVTMILPLGSESHNYEPSPSDVIAIDQSDMFIYTGDYMEGWVSNIVGNLNDTMVVDVSQGITLDKVEDEDEEHSTDDGHHHDYDPHIWTSPRNAMVIVDNITNALCELDSQNADYYQSNAQEYKLKLQNLDDEFQSVVDNGNTNKIFFGGKFALYYLARDYGLEYTSAYDSCSDETEPSAKAVANIISQMKQQHIPVIFYEELTNPTVAETIANETGATPLLFHSCHNVSKEEFESGATYLSLMEQNVENLRIALDTPTLDTDTNTTSTIEDTSSLLGILKTLISYPFMRQALIVGPLVSLCASLLGVTLVLKRYSMIGDGLSHVGFGALSIAMAMNVAPLKVSIPVVIVSAFFLLKISQNSKIKGDSAIAIISSSALAIGITVTSLTSGLSTDINNYMFGSILALSKSDVYLSVILSILVIVLYLVFYNKIFTVTFDENFAKATGIHTDVYNFLIAILTAITIVIGMRLMGSLLISSLIIFPSLSSMRVFNSFKSVILSSAVISIVCFLVGIFVSYVLGIPVGASIVITNLIVFLMFLCVGKATKRS